MMYAPNPHSKSPPIFYSEKSQKRTDLATLFLVHFGALPFLDYFTPLKNPRKLLTYKGLCIEAEGTRTLNLRIDSPML